MEFKRLDEKSDKIPVALDKMFQRKDTAKFGLGGMVKNEEKFQDDAFNSPTFEKKGPMTP